MMMSGRARGESLTPGVNKQPPASPGPTGGEGAEEMSAERALLLGPNQNITPQKGCPAALCGSVHPTQQPG